MSRRRNRVHNFEWFDALADLGLKVIPLRENSKTPLCKNWNKKWDRKKNLQKIRQFPNSNLGLLLGEIIDVEGDSEEANKIIDELIGDYPHPLYSSTKSTHHLFLTPFKGFRKLEWNKIEFRGYGHQSVLPPSRIEETEYMWRRGFCFPVPPMPKNLLDFFYSKLNKNKNTSIIKPGHIKIRCFACEKPLFINKKRHQLELAVFKILNQRWQCNGCRKAELQAACRLIRSGISDVSLIKSKIN